MTPALDLAAAFHARLLVMLEAYVDESYRANVEGVPDDRPRVLVVAGWVGEGEAWRELEAKWRIALDRESLTEFHSSDCLTGYGEFKPWDLDKRIAFRRELIGYINESRIIGATASLTVSEPEAPLAKRMDYTIALFYCMSELTRVAWIRPAGERVAYIVDELNKGRENLQRARDDLRWKLKLDSIRSRVGPAAFDRSSEVLPLQAADLLAHEAYLQRAREVDRISGMRTEFSMLLRQVLFRKTLHVDTSLDPHLIDYDRIDSGDDDAIIT